MPAWNIPFGHLNHVPAVPSRDISGCVWRHQHISMPEMCGWDICSHLWRSQLHTLPSRDVLHSHRSNIQCNLPAVPSRLLFSARIVSMLCLLRRELLKHVRGLVLHDLPSKHVLERHSSAQLKLVPPLPLRHILPGKRNILSLVCFGCQDHEQPICHTDTSHRVAEPVLHAISGRRHQKQGIQCDH